MLFWTGLCLLGYEATSSQRNSCTLSITSWRGGTPAEGCSISNVTLVRRKDSPSPAGPAKAATVPPQCRRSAAPASPHPGAPTHFWVQIGSKNVPQKNRKTDLGKKSPKGPQWPNLGPKLYQNCSKTVPQKRHVWQMANIDSGCYLLYFVYIWGPQVALKTASKSHLTKKQLQSSTNPIIC